MTSDADNTTEVPPDTYDEQVEEGNGAAPKRGRLSAGVWAAIALSVVVAALITYSLLRIAGEEHYQSCIAAVNGRYGTASDPLTRLARVNGVKACSRSPF